MEAPDPDHRYRCSACGNLTRFDVVERIRFRRFYHFSLGGDLRIEEEEILEDQVEQVLCRWCGSGGSVEVVARIGAGEEAGRPSGGA